MSYSNNELVNATRSMRHLAYLKSQFGKSGSIYKQDELIGKIQKLEQDLKAVDYFALLYQNVNTDYPIRAMNFVFHVTRLNDWIGKDLTPFKEWITSMEQLQVNLFGLPFDNNSHAKISNSYGDEFTFALYISNDKVNIHIWDCAGSTSVMQVSFVNGELSQQIIHQIQNTINDYTRGKINCSDCGKQIYRSEIAGRYFAGVYCKDCWDGKWRAIEAKETYD